MYTCVLNYLEKIVKNQLNTNFMFTAQHAHYRIWRKIYEKKRYKITSKSGFIHFIVWTVFVASICNRNII